MDEELPNDDVFILDVEQYVPILDPTKHGMPTAKKFDPNAYFITSGDAVQKSKVLERDLWTYAGYVRKLSCERIAAEKKITYAKAQELHRSGQRPKQPASWVEFEKDVWKAAGAARKLVAKLIQVRGESIFLETEWHNHSLLCIPKDPRNAK